MYNDLSSVWLELLTRPIDNPSVKCFREFLCNFVSPWLLRSPSYICRCFIHFPSTDSSHSTRSLTHWKRLSFQPASFLLATIFLFAIFASWIVIVASVGEVLNSRLGVLAPSLSKSVILLYTGVFIFRNSIHITLPIYSEVQACKHTHTCTETPAIVDCMPNFPCSVIFLFFYDLLTV